MAQGKTAPDTMLKADDLTLVAKAEKDGKLRLARPTGGASHRIFL